MLAKRRNILSQHGPMEFLKGTAAQYLQADGGSSYVPVFAAHHLKHIACMAHIRRDIFEARDQAPLAVDLILAAMQKLYRIERQAKEQRLSLAERLELRQQQAKPLFTDLDGYPNPGFAYNPPREYRFTDSNNPIFIFDSLGLRRLPAVGSFAQSLSARLDLEYHLRLCLVFCNEHLTGLPRIHLHLRSQRGLTNGAGGSTAPPLRPRTLRLHTFPGRCASPAPGVIARS
jgi:hypothetical protein